MKNYEKPQLFKTLGILLALSILLALPTAVLAADAYPSKPVRIIVPTAPGGTNDIIGRMLAAKLTVRLGKQVIVENRAGAGQIIGTDVVAKAAPDGYTLLFVANSPSDATQKVPYDPVKDFAAIAKLGSSSSYLVVGPSVPANIDSVKKFIALAKQKPGQLICAAYGIGSFNHLGTELFKIKADINFRIVQFKGGGPAMIDLLGGHSDFMFGSIIAQMPYIKSGKFRPLAGGGVKRSLIQPNVPTFAEAGVPGYEANWYGILAPAGTPAPIVDRLSREIKAILTSDDVKKQFMEWGVEADYMGPAEFDPFRMRALNTWKSVVKEINFKVE
jgi:tripartite-type tricarboxylate transporter receptor subunit TctC